MLDVITDEILAHYQFSNISDSQVNSCDIIRKVVASGIGCSLLPEKAIDDSLISIPSQHANKLEFVVVHHKDRILSSAAEKWIALMTKK